MPWITSVLAYSPAVVSEAEGRGKVNASEAGLVPSVDISSDSSTKSFLNFPLPVVPTSSNSYIRVYEYSKHIFRLLRARTRLHDLQTFDFVVYVCDLLHLVVTIGLCALCATVASPRVTKVKFSIKKKNYLNSCL